MRSWSGQDGCADAAGALDFSATHGDRFPENLDRSGFAAAVAAVTPLVSASLDELRTDSLNDLRENNGTLKPGDVKDAAERVGGAQALINGYVALGLPQALETDDRLHGAVAGDAANALLHPTFDAHSAVPAPMVPAQVANFIRYWRDAEAVSLRRTRSGCLLEPPDPARADPAPVRAVRSRVRAVAGRRRPPRREQPARRLDDRPARADPCRAGGPPEPAAHSRHARAGAHAGSEHAGDAGSGRRPAPPRPAAARARILRAPRARGNAIRFSVRCLSGTCRIGTTVTAGRRTVARAGALTLRPGQRAHGDRQAHLSGTAGARAPRPVARHRHRDARRNGAPAREQVADVAQDAGADPGPNFRVDVRLSTTAPSVLSADAPTALPDSHRHRL